jgi:hypothetical protein
MKMTTIDEAKKTITRHGVTWKLSTCGLTSVVAEYGSDIVGAVLTAGDYYPPMIDATERLEIEDKCQSKMIARAYISTPALRGPLERMSYTGAEAQVNK